MTNMPLNSNSDILFLLQAKMTNPNGDLDSDNEPRMDEMTKINLVSDGRFKRYPRDFWEYNGEDIFVSRKANVSTSSERAESLIGKRCTNNNKNLLLEKCRDARVFGALITNKKLPEIDVLGDDKTVIAKVKIESQKVTITMNDANIEEASYELDDRKYTATKKKKHTVIEIQDGLKPNVDYIGNLTIKYNNGDQKDSQIEFTTFGEDDDDGSKGSSVNIVGPVQFSWGYSMHPVELVESTAITSAFSSNEGKGSTIGRSPQLYYSLIGFSGTVSRLRAHATGMTEQDLNVLDYSIIHAIPAMSTKTKQGQLPVLFIRVQYQDGADDFLGDLRDFIDVEVNRQLEGEYVVRSIKDLTLKAKDLCDVLSTNKKKIASITLFQDPRLKFSDVLEESLEKELTGRGLTINTVPQTYPAGGTVESN